MKTKFFLVLSLACALSSCKKVMNESVPTTTPEVASLVPGSSLPRFGIVAWSRLIGGADNEYGMTTIKTRDGGYLLIGASASAVSGHWSNHGGNDAVVVKVDENGNRIWSRNYGGSAQDEVRAVIYGQNGGYLLVGTSTSANGDVASNKGNQDVWVFQISEEGQIGWSTTFGGTKNDAGMAVVARPMGGYVVACLSESNDGDVSGQTGNAMTWILKLDVNGNKISAQGYGGRSSSRPVGIVALQNGYVIGNMAAGIPGGPVGLSMDAWIFQVRENGELLWSAVYGGTGMDIPYSFIQTPDGGFVLSGYTESTDGDIPSNRGDFDGWVLKLNSFGVRQWSRTFGGAGRDLLYAVTPGSNGELLLAGSYYNQSSDAWLLKLDASGNKLASKTYGGPGREEVGGIVPAGSGNYVLAGFTEGGDGDVAGGNGGADLWIFKVQN